MDVGGEFAVEASFYGDPGRLGALLAADDAALSGANLKLLLARLCGLTVTRARRRILARPEDGLRVDAYA